MTSRTTQRFQEAISRLSEQIQQQACEAYRLFRENLSITGVCDTVAFIQENRSTPARLSFHYRALAVRDGDAVVSFWIGSHAEYDDLPSGCRGGIWLVDHVIQ